MFEDVLEINQALESRDMDKFLAIHRKMESKYHNRIRDFEKSMWGYSPQYGFTYEALGEDSLRENLFSMKYKIEGYLEDTGGLRNKMKRSFLSMAPTEEVSLKKRSGSVIEKISALVDTDLFFIDDCSVVIEEGDCFIRNLPNGTSEYYEVQDRGFIKGTGGAMPDHYQTKVKKITKATFDSYMKSQENEDTVKPVKIFISHASKDVKYVKKIVEFLEEMNIPEDGIFCSSIPEYGIPGGQKIYPYLREQFENMNLHVIFVLSDNYYDSVPCMNEMGAAWVMRHNYTTILLPGFAFSKIQGVLDPQEISTKLDDSIETVNVRLAELRDMVVKEFGLNPMNANKWERKRNEFIAGIQSIKDSDDQTETAKAKETLRISSTALEILTAVSKDIGGLFIRAQDITGNVQLSTNSEVIFSSAVNREIAQWDDAIKELLRIECVELVGTKGGRIYKITSKGYSVVDNSEKNV